VRAFSACGNGVSSQAVDTGTTHLDARADASPDAPLPPLLSRWVAIEPGTFLMGSTPERPWGRGAYNEDQVQVTLAGRFQLGRYEVTQAEWTAHGLPNPSGLDPKFPDAGGDAIGDRYPVGRVNWYEAAAFANVLSERHIPPLPKCYSFENCTGEVGMGYACEWARNTAATIYACEGYRLPTEAEWEYAIRAGTTTDFYGGDHVVEPGESISASRPEPALEPIAWYVYNSGRMTHPVGTKKPNPWGLFDMAGNAFEWVNDYYDGLGYGKGPFTDPEGVVPTVENVLRGGSAGSSPAVMRSVRRFHSPPQDRTVQTGFRLARTLKPGEPVDTD
jgi:formylglycine-generating enzyme